MCACLRVVRRHASAAALTLTARRSFYHDFFVGHSAPELTEIFCRADEVIFEKSTGFDLSALKDKGIFEVQGTLAAGHPACRFVIRKQPTGGGEEAGSAECAGESASRRGRS